MNRRLIDEGFLLNREKLDTYLRFHLILYSIFICYNNKNPLTKVVYEMFSAMLNYIGMDLGSSQIRIYQRDKIILEETSAAVVDNITGRVLGFGTDALIRYHQRPENNRLEYPIKNGLITNYDMVKDMLSFFLNKSLRRTVSRPNVIVSVPVEISSVTRHVLVDALIHAGAQSVYLIPAPAAAAVGAGLDITIPTVSFSLVIGKDVSNIGIYGCSGIIAQDSVAFGGYNIDLGICHYIQDKYNILISLGQAEKLKTEILSVTKSSIDTTCTVRGRRINDGVEVVIELSINEMTTVMQHIIQPIIHLIKRILRNATPEMADDFSKNGMLLCGGSAQLNGLKDWISFSIGIPVTIPEEPSSLVVKGCFSAYKMEKTHSLLIENGEKYYGGT